MKRQGIMTNQRSGRAVIDDLLHGELRKNLKRDLNELYHFYVNDAERERLSKMRRGRRLFYLTVWLLRSLFMKLNPTRRILLLLSFFFLFSENWQWSSKRVEVNINLAALSFLIILLILMLELKDKLLAFDELEAGRKVQQALMPHFIPEIAGWSIWLYTRPANDVGGDLVDYMDYDGNKFGFAIGDVAGKGLGAALLMSKLQSSLRALAYRENSLCDLGRHLNEIFCRDSLPEKFASLLYIVLRPGENRIKLLNAGHYPPILLSNGTAKTLPRGGPALGILKSSVYVEQSLEMSNGDILVAYSDGVTESRNSEGEFYGDQRLISKLLDLDSSTATELGKGVLQSVEMFLGDERPNDDLSLVVIKKLG
ncbi:MAG: PP2C family protein-serine/threonine phosphatase [Candidatus Kryptoniota bacterium]